MKISRVDLLEQYDRASKDWPFISDLEKQHELPPYLLYAVGSRETNLKNILGDGNHGHGVFQLDDRWHAIAVGFDTRVDLQAKTAAIMLREGYRKYGDWLYSCNVYNSGSINTEKTAGGDYGPDVMERMKFLQDNVHPEVDKLDIVIAKLDEILRKIQ